MDDDHLDRRDPDVSDAHPVLSVLEGGLAGDRSDLSTRRPCRFPLTLRAPAADAPHRRWQPASEVSRLLTSLRAALPGVRANPDGNNNAERGDVRAVSALLSFVMRVRSGS